MRNLTEDSVNPRKKNSRSFLRGIFLLVPLAITLLASPGAVAQRNPNYRLCFPDTTWFGGTPNIDGNVASDNGWGGAFRYTFPSGVTLPNIVVQGLKDGSFIYLSFEVHKDADFADQDVIVLTFGPGGGAADDRRIHVFPVFTGVGAAGNGAPRELNYYTNSGNWNQGGVASSPGWLSGNMKVTSQVAGQDHAYFVEMRIPINANPQLGIDFPANGDFGFYFNVIRVTTSGMTSTAVEKAWPPPPGTPEIGSFLEANTPVPDKWGNGTRGAASCNGVSFGTADIKTNQNPTSKITLNGSNSFSVDAHNSSRDGAGNFIAASQVTARFLISDWGLTSNWNPVPAANNPTPPANIPANSTTPLSTLGWTLSQQEKCQFIGKSGVFDNVNNVQIPGDPNCPNQNPTLTLHQCILAELDSASGNNTLFVNKSAVRNMDFGLASKFGAQPARIGPFKEALPPGRSAHQLDLHVLTKEDFFPSGEMPGTIARATSERGRPVSQLTWVVQGYRYTGRFIIIKNKKYEILDDVGAFGYIVQHFGATKAQWVHQFAGDGLKNVMKNVYQINILPGKVAMVNTQVEAKEMPSKPTTCFGRAPTNTPTILLIGVFALGLIVYRPRRRKSQ